MGVSAPSLHIESTDSMIYGSTSIYYCTSTYGRNVNVNLHTTWIGFALTTLFFVTSA